MQKWFETVAVQRKIESLGGDRVGKKKLGLTSILTICLLPMDEFPIFLDFFLPFLYFLFSSVEFQGMPPTLNILGEHKTPSIVSLQTFQSGLYLHPAYTIQLSY